MASATGKKKEASELASDDSVSGPTGSSSSESRSSSDNSCSAQLSWPIKKTPHFSVNEGKSNPQLNAECCDSESVLTKEASNLSG